MNKLQHLKQESLNKKYQGKLSTWIGKVTLILRLEYVSEKEIWIVSLFEERIIRNKFQNGILAVERYLDEKEYELRKYK